MNWEEFKLKSEQKFNKLKLESVWGFQIQAGTRWNPGLQKRQIDELEKQFGFTFPLDYRQMLEVINGVDKEQIAINPEDHTEYEYQRRIYRYPEDFELTAHLRNEIEMNMEFVFEALHLSGFETSDVMGIVPLYEHRALVVFGDKNLSPVISIHQGDDVIVYGNSLMEYWGKELRMF